MPGTIREETLDQPIDGPRTLQHVDGATLWRVSASRASAELDAHRRLAAHPLAVPGLTHRDEALVFPASSPVADLSDVVEALSRGAPRVLETTPRHFLEALGGPVDAVRALARVGVRRRRIDRLLDRPRMLPTIAGPDLGGVLPGALRSGAEGPFALSVRHGRAEGWPVLDLASLALRAGLDTRAVHREAGGGDAAFALAMLHEALRELVIARSDVDREHFLAYARACLEELAPDEPPRVSLSVVAPSFLPTELFAPVGPDVDAAHARRVLRDWDGLAVGGTRVRVTTEPPLARPARAFAFEPRRERRRRLFSRFDEGVAFDDEGLYSATPEVLATRVAAGLSGVVVDATCGIGAIAIALARTEGVTKVIAIDLDERRLAMAVRNARLYGVADRITFRHGDALALVPELVSDALVIDPPWGGRDYDRERVALSDLPMSIAPLLERSGAIVLKLPRSFDVATLPAGFVVEPLVDERGVLKMLVARRGLRSTSVP